MPNDLTPRCVAADLGFTEGPLWTTRGSLMLVGMSRGMIHDIDPATGTVRTAAETGGSPSGLAEDAQGRVWVAQGGHPPARGGRPAAPGIQCLSPPGIGTPGQKPADVDDVLTEGFDAPNDLVIGPDGRLWFTDPRGPALAGTPEPGRLWVFDPRPGPGTVAAAVVAQGAFFPNGLAFAPDGDALYVAETFTGRILRYRRNGAGLSAPAVFATLPEGRPDGLAFDRAGHLLVAATTAFAVLVLDPTGRTVERIPLGDGALATNLCFGGPELRTLYITSPKGGRVFAVERTIPGLPLPPFRTAGR